jgi:hypothetical protein
LDSIVARALLVADFIDSIGQKQTFKGPPATSPYWPPNPKKVCSNCSLSTLITIAQNKDANIAPSKNQANF